MNGETMSSRVAVIEEAAKSRDREIRDLKSGLSDANKKLDSALRLLAKLEDLPEKVTELTVDRHEASGAIKLGKFVIGTGFFGLVGSAAFGIWHFFVGR